MKKNLILIITLAALSLPFVGCRKSTVVKETTTEPTGPVELKLKWPPGRTMVQNMDFKQVAEISGGGIPRPMKQDMTMGQQYQLTVLKELPGGGHEIEMEFLNTKIAMKMGDKQTVDYDSSKSSADATNPVAAIFGKMNGAKLVYTLDATNKVEKVGGVDELQARLSGGGGRDPSGMFKSIFNEDYFKQMMNNGHNLPTKPVQPGDSWPVKLEVTMGDMGTMVMDFTNTFENWELHDNRYCARISIDGTVKGKMGQNPKMKGMSMSIQDGKSSGQTYFDLDMGMFVETTLQQDIKMFMTIPNQRPGNPPGGAKTQTITNLMHQTIVTKLGSVK